MYSNPRNFSKPEIAARFIFCLFILFSGTGLGEVPAKPASNKLPNIKSTLTLAKVEGESQNDTSTVEVSLNQKPGWGKVDVDDHGTFLQIILPGTIVPNPGKFYDIKSPYIEKIAVFQITQQDAGVRLFVNKDAAKVKEATTADILTDHVIITLDHKKLESILPQAPLSQQIEGVPTADEVVSKVEVKNNIPEPANLIKSSDSGLAIKFKDTMDLRKKLIGVSAFSGIMIAGLLFLYFMRPFLRKKRAFKRQEAIAQIKILASHSLAPKQKLALIEIAGQQILLGISSDSINYLTTVNKPNQSVLREVNPPAKIQMLKSAEMQQSTTAGQQAPILGKRIPTANGKIIRQPKRQGATKVVGSNLSPNSTFVTTVDDSGIKEIISENEEAPVPKSSPTSSIDDVTRLIREKLKNLPTI